MSSPTPIITPADVAEAIKRLETASLAADHGRGAWTKTRTIRGREVRLEYRGEDAPMGRFGGGWDWEIGIQLGRRGLKGTIIINLLVCSVRIAPRKAVARG